MTFLTTLWKIQLKAIILAALVITPAVAADDQDDQIKKDLLAVISLEGLKRRLRGTDAIGVFTKLSLKNQVDDFLESLRVYHNGTHEITLDQLRQRYELLLMKVLSLLEDGDTQLSRDIAGSREVLWSRLASPDSFSQL